MLCQECKQRQATVHMTKIINNEKTERHFCEDCAKQHEDLTDMAAFSVNSLIASFMDMAGPHAALPETSRVHCPTCDMEYSHFKKSGLLGCKECYKRFEKGLYPVLRKIQGRTEHSGKVPKRSGTVILLQKQIKTLKQDLKHAVQTEAFEEAARIRDQLKELEKPRQEEREG